ncbi:SRPBCC family protein [Litorivivens sp.]|uniref:SRPBCC family protein n=1 Tax=Litorivivens sp. TaxID=2020868 RepID=UPI00356500DA
MNGEAKARVVMKVPRDQAWKRLRDLGQAHNYVPGIIKTEITTAKKEGVGASRKVYQSETRALDETVVEWDEGHGFLIKLHRGEHGSQPPFKEAYFRYQLDDAGNNQTALTTSLLFTMRWGRLGDFLHRRVLANVFRSVIRDVALSMKAYYESGEPTTPEKLKQIKADLKAK